MSDTPIRQVQRTFGTRRNGRPTIGFFTVSIGRDPVCLQAWLGMVDAARDHDVNLICFVGDELGSHQDFHDQANTLYDLVNAGNVDGLVMWNSALSNFIGPEAFELFCAQFQPLPIVDLDHPPESVTASYSCRAMHDVISHLIEVHHFRRLAFIRGPEGNQEAEYRYRAYMDMLKQYDLPVSQELVAMPGFWYEESGKEAIRMLLDQRAVDVEAIIASSDRLALGAIEALQERGFRVPDDVAVVGFDNITDGNYSTPPLTSVPYPLHLMGQRAIAKILTQFEGKDDFEPGEVPVTLVVRQSCGCIDPVLLQAAAGPVTASNEVVDTAFSRHREEMLMEVTSLLGEVGTAAIWAGQLVDACEAEVRQHSAGGVLRTLDELLSYSVGVHGKVSVWHNVISALRRHLLPVLAHDEKALLRVEDLWQQARIMIGERRSRFQGARALRGQHQAQVLRELSQKLITTFDVNTLMDILSENLPRLGIPTCYLALYDNPETPTELARLRLVYTEKGRLELGTDGHRFSSVSLVPEEFLSSESAYNLVALPLYFKESQLGFVLLDAGLREGSVYEALRGEISSALQGALLLGEVTRQKYILDTFMANIPDSIYFKDRDSRIIRCNRSLAKLFQVDDPSALIGKTDLDLFPREQAQRKYDQEQKIIRTGQPLLELEEPDAGGRWALTTKMPLRDEEGQIIGTFGISRDITKLKDTERELLRHRENLEERVAKRTTELTEANRHLQAEITERARAENALRVSERQYRLLAENVMDGVLLLRQNSHIMFTNTVFAAMLGYAPEQLVGSTLLHVFHEREQEVARARLSGSEDDVPDNRWQAEMLARDGRAVWTEIDQTLIQWDNMPAILLTIRDITDRKIREQHLEAERSRLHQENMTLKSTIAERYRFGAIVGKSVAMQRIYELILNAATSDVNTLLSGESGTGKELMARTIHDLSTRKHHVFVAVNCASIPETLFEREFFGHRRGTFTGADRDRPGLFDRAHQGTLFLDEVTELTTGAQARLLRVLQDGSYTPLGSTQAKQADVLIVAATNKDCSALIAQGLLREDFFYRIGVIEIQIPALRERKEDLPLLIEHLLEQYRSKQAELHGRVPPDVPAEPAALPAELIRAFYTYHWPGNVRELQNILHRYLATRRLDLILPRLGATAGPSDLMDLPDDLHGVPLPEAVKTYEKRIIAEALAQYHGRTRPTAEHLGITQRTLQNKIKQYRLRENG